MPILLGSGLKKLFEIANENSTLPELLPLIAGFIVSFAVGVLAIHYLLRFLRTHPLTLFIWYRLLLAIVLFFWFVK